MTASQALHDFLTKDSDISEIAGENVYFGIAPSQDSGNTYAVIKPAGENSVREVGYVSVVFELDCTSNDQYKLEKLSGLVKTKLARYSGAMGDLEIGVCTATQKSGLQKEWIVNEDKSFTAIIEIRMNYKE